MTRGKYGESPLPACMPQEMGLKGGEIEGEKSLWGLRKQPRSTQEKGQYCTFFTVHIIGLLQMWWLYRIVDFSACFVSCSFNSILPCVYLQVMLPAVESHQLISAAQILLKAQTQINCNFPYSLAALAINWCSWKALYVKVLHIDVKVFTVFMFVMHVESSLRIAVIKWWTCMHKQRIIDDF